MRRLQFVLCAVLCLLFAPQVFAQEGVKVVPIGNTIQPDGGGAPAKSGAKPKARRPRMVPQAMVKPGKTFIVESANAMSSGINQVGDTVYFRSTEAVGGVIGVGAVAKGRVSQVDDSKKAGKLVVQIQSIEALNGEAVDISGDVTVEGKGGQASLATGERFTATVDEKTVVRKKPKKKAPPPPAYKQAFAEIRGKGVKADIKKGLVRGKVQVVLEPPKGVSVDDLDSGSFAIVRVNAQDLPEAVSPVAGKLLAGDRNKNGSADVLFEFAAWDFLKFQPRGLNTVTFRGKLRDGSEYEASAKATIDY